MLYTTLFVCNMINVAPQYVCCLTYLTWGFCTHQNKSQTTGWSWRKILISPSIPAFLPLTLLFPFPGGVGDVLQHPFKTLSKDAFGYKKKINKFGGLFPIEYAVNLLLVKPRRTPEGGVRAGHSATFWQSHWNYLGKVQATNQRKLTQTGEAFTSAEHEGWTCEKSYDKEKSLFCLVSSTFSCHFTWPPIVPLHLSPSCSL